MLLPKPRIRALRNNPRITHANLGSEDLLCKPRIRTQSSRIAQPNLGHPRQQTHDRSRTQSSSAIRGNVGSLQRMAELLCVRDRSWLLLCSGWPNCFACAIDHGFVAVDGRGLVVRSQKIACGSEVYMCDPRIIAQKLCPRFSLQNPRMVRIRTLRITYIYIVIYIQPSIYYI